MNLVEAWKQQQVLPLEELLAITRPVLVGGAVQLFREIFPDFGAVAEAEIRNDTYGKYVQGTHMALPPTADSHRFGPWMPGYTVAFKGFTGSRSGMQRHDHFRLFQASEDAARKPGGRRYRDHIWEVTARVDWSTEPDRGKVKGVRAGLFGDTPTALPQMMGYVFQVFRHVDLCGSTDPRKPTRGRCTRAPRENVAGDGRGFFVGWEFESEEFDTDEALTAELTDACHTAWSAMQRALAFPPPE